MLEKRVSQMADDLLAETEASGTENCGVAVICVSDDSEEQLKVTARVCGKSAYCLKGMVSTVLQVLSDLPIPLRLHYLACMQQDIAEKLNEIGQSTPDAEQKG